MIQDRKTDLIEHKTIRPLDFIIVHLLMIKSSNLTSPIKNNTIGSFLSINYILNYIKSDSRDTVMGKYFNILDYDSPLSHAKINK